ncbi:MAG: hypothetical protein J7647_01090 [Cyanobacteria bacterium SBLK]|nr:hypothetical protein [Cyanobacteria bacterium SBLK]
MRCLPQSSAIASLFTIILFLGSGCGASKIAQCNQIIEVANALEEVRVSADNEQADTTQTMLQVVDAMEQASKDMQSLELSDETLEKLRGEFIKMYAETSSATRTFLEAFNKKDRETLDKAIAELHRATQPEQELVNQINSYCLGN